MRDPRTLGPTPRLPSILDYLDEQAAAPVAAGAMVQAAAPPPSVASRIAGMASGVVGGIGGALTAPFRALGEQYDLGTEAARLRNQQARAALDAEARRAQLEQTQFPAQQAQAQAQAREQGVLTERIGQAQDPRLRDSLIRGAATGTFRPFEVEPGPAELAAYQSVLGMQEETARQKLIAQREMQQARLQAGLQQETNRLDNAGRLQIAQVGKLPGVEDEKAMRAEFEGLGKEFSTVRQAYKTLHAVDDTKAGDLTLLVQFMKLIDPGASVREGDLATAENAGGVPGWLVAQYERLRASGGRIDSRLRKDYLAQAENLYQARLGSHRNIEKQYGEIAVRRGFDPRNVVTDLVGPDDAPKGPRKATQDDVERVYQKLGTEDHGKLIEALRAEGLEF